MNRHDQQPDSRPESYATDATTLAQRIEEMEQRLAVERAQLTAHARAFGGKVRRRLTSPTALIFSASVGFVASELLGARTTIIRDAQRRGESKAAQKAAGKSLFASITKPLLPLLRVGVLGFFAKKNKDIADTVEANANGMPVESSDSVTLH